MGVPSLLVFLLVCASGVGIFAMTAFESAASLRGEVGVLQSEVTTLTATVAGLQTQNDHYENLMTRVRAATGSLQASLAELNQLAETTAP